MVLGRLVGVEAGEKPGQASCRPALRSLSIAYQSRGLQSDGQDSTMRFQEERAEGDFSAPVSQLRVAYAPWQSRWKVEVGRLGSLDEAAIAFLMVRGSKLGLSFANG